MINTYRVPIVTAVVVVIIAIGGVLITCDTPLVCCWTWAAVWCFRAVRTGVVPMLRMMNLPMDGHEHAHHHA